MECDLTAPVIEGRSAIPLHFPLRAVWVATNTPAHRIPTHGTDFFAQRYAYDFMMLNEDGSPLPPSQAIRYVLASVAVEECFSWAQPVFSPASGIIVGIGEGWPDRARPMFVPNFIVMRLGPRIARSGDFRGLTGNYIILRSGADFILLAHLRCGSIRVRLGEGVALGQQIAEVGNSGNTSIPHLHIQAMDRADPWCARPIPCWFTDIEGWNGAEWEALPDGMPKKSQRVRFLGDSHIAKHSEAAQPTKATPGFEALS